MVQALGRHLSGARAAALSRKFGRSCLEIAFPAHSLILSLVISEHCLVLIEKNYKNKIHLWDHLLPLPPTPGSEGSEALMCNSGSPWKDIEIGSLLSLPFLWNYVEYISLEEASWQEVTHPPLCSVMGSSFHVDRSHYEPQPMGKHQTASLETVALISCSWAQRSGLSFWKNWAPNSFPSSSPYHLWGEHCWPLPS